MSNGAREDISDLEAQGPESLGLFRRANRARMLVIALVLVLPSLMLHHLWVAPTSAGEDDLIYYYPLRKMVGQTLREGRWPLHSPLEATGMPLMADPQSAVMYPPTWLFAAAPARLAYSITLLMAFSIAGAGAYLYLRRLGLVRPAACFGAVAFMFCGFLVGHRVHWSVLHAGAWLPWALWAIELLRHRPLAGATALAPVGFLMIAAGHWPTLIHMGMIIAAYLLLRARPLWRALPLAAAGGALAVAMAWPQVDLTRQLLAAATRERIGYAMAGENSFFPPSAALGIFPFLFGTRTPGFYSQPWWGPWHLCETLGYVGLVTLVLGFAAIWTMYRKRNCRLPVAERPLAGHCRVGREGEEAPAGGSSIRPAPSMSSIVRVWVWIGLGAFIWMLGYYLPTYKLIHMLPVLGVVRCPARMILAVDMALATLAAVAVHGAIVAEPGRPPGLAGTIGRGATVVLPAVMAATLLLLAAAGCVSVVFFGGTLQFFDGGGTDALRAVVPINPAVWIPLVLAGVTALVVRGWLGRPAERAPGLVCLLVLDLFFVTRFMDVPKDWMDGGPSAEVSPARAVVGSDGARLGSPGHCGPKSPRDPGARAWGQGGGSTRTGRVPGLWEPEYRVWGIGADYHNRANELLLPKTACSLGVGTINTYGPFQSPALPHLMGFRIFGTNRNWSWLLRENRLLSLYGVRYILTDRADVREEIESVRAPAKTEGPDAVDGETGPILTSDWWLDRAEMADGVIRLRTPVLWHWSIAKQPVDAASLEPNAVYRIALDARAPEGGAANFLRADLLEMPGDVLGRQIEELGLTVNEDEMGARWRHFEWTFRAPAEMRRPVYFRLFTMSERPIEVRNVSLGRSAPVEPRWAAGLLPAGEPVYRKVAELPALDGRSAAVGVYENRLAAGPARRPPLRKMTGEEIEAVKWSTAVPGALPELGVRVEAAPMRAIWKVTLPATVVWVLLLAGISLWRSRASG